MSERPGVNERVYVDLGDSIQSGGEMSGVITEVNDQFVYINGYRIYWSEVLYLELLA